VDDISRIDISLDSRAITFENPTGGRATGGLAAGGRKGAPSRWVAPGERVTLVDIDGPGVVRHIWLTVRPAPPDVMRALVLEAFYDGRPEPSISAPLLDYFGLAHGRPVPFASAMATAQEGRGFNSYLPLPFRRHLRMELRNASALPMLLYYQVDLTLQPDGLAPDAGYLHAAFRRENPTTMGRDFVIADGLAGPGRFAGCVVGVRVLDEGTWYGEGEVKMYRDGDVAAGRPTICGTGLEDYVGSAWGMGRHAAPYGGAPTDVRRDGAPQPDLIGFYRWHVPDPVTFERELTVTIQQIGMHRFPTGPEGEAGFTAYAASHPAAGDGWFRDARGTTAIGICERVDDYCSTAFTYCSVPQPVPRVDPGAAAAGIERRDYESPDPMEDFFG
jgi:hypothetical protein